MFYHVCYVVFSKKIVCNDECKLFIFQKIVEYKQTNFSKLFFAECNKKIIFN